MITKITNFKQLNVKAITDIVCTLDCVHIVCMIKVSRST